MISGLATVLPYAVAPVAAAGASGAVAAFRPPSNLLRSVIEHVAAGVALAAAAVEVIPTAVGMHRPWGLIVGFTLGIALMLGVHWLNPATTPMPRARSRRILAACVRLRRPRAIYPAR